MAIERRLSMACDYRNDVRTLIYKEVKKNLRSAISLTWWIAFFYANHRREKTERERL